MKIPQLFEQKKIVFSLEVFPPKKTGALETVYHTLAGLPDIPADFVSVTYGAGGSNIQKSKTCEICGHIKERYHIEPVAHLTCVGATKEEISRTLEDLKAKGVENILALRGDRNPEINLPSDFAHASDLASFIRSYDSSFSLSGACYPEVHAESDSMEEDIANLKIKVDSGVDHLVTQLFFDNGCFYEFRDQVRAAGIRVPIEAGIMPIINKGQIEKTVTMCGASLPSKFVTLLNKFADDPEALKAAGISYATDQIIDLLANGVQGIHVYTMNNLDLARQIYTNIKGIVESANR